MTYEYKFVKLELSGFWTVKTEMDHHAVIEQHATDGWRLVQIFAPAIAGYGQATYFELIFERPKAGGSESVD